MDDKYAATTMIRDGVQVKVVVTIGIDDAWAAYWGPLDWSDRKVAFTGHLLSEEEAVRVWGGGYLGKRYRKGWEDVTKV